MPPAYKSKLTKKPSARARNPADPREEACRERCKAYGIPPDAIYEGRPLWTRFLSEVETALKAEEIQQTAGARATRFSD
jgi:hypothetical protein